MLNTNVSDNATAPDPGSESDADVCQQDPWDLECVTRRLWQILAPVIIVVGLLGNLLVVIVFSRLHFSKSSTLVHMFILAITDSVILCLGPTRHWALNTFDFDIRGISDAGCKLHLFLLYTTLDYSAWILVSVTVERALSVLRPLHVRGWFTVRRTLIRLSLILVILCGINGHFFFSNALVRPAKTDAETTPGWNNKTEVTPTMLATTLTVQPIGNSSVTTGCCPHSGTPSAVTRTPGATASAPVDLNTAATSPALDQRSDSPLSARRSTGVTLATQASSLGSYECMSVDKAWEDFEEFYFVYVALCFESFIPFIVMIVCNSFIVVSIRRAMKNRPRGTTRRELESFADPPGNGHAAHAAESHLANDYNLYPQGSEGSSDVEDDLHSSISVGHLHSSMSVDDKHISACVDLPSRSVPGSRCLASSLHHRQHGQRRSKKTGGTSSVVTRMLVVVTTVFLMTTLPSVIFFVVDSYLRDKGSGNETAHVNKALDLSKAVTSLLQYCNYGCNFLLYSMHSKRFLREAKVLFGLVNKRLRSYVNSQGISNTRSRSSSQVASLQQSTSGRDRRGSQASDLQTRPAVVLMPDCPEPGRQPDKPAECGGSKPGESIHLPTGGGSPSASVAHAHGTLLDLREGSGSDGSPSELSSSWI